MLSIGLIILGILLLVAGGEVMLRGAVGLATILRLTPAVIGLTVVAAGTSVPELAVSGFAAMKGNAAITVGNVVGSNIFNLTVILGISALIAPLAIGGNTIRLEYPVMAIATLMLVAVAHKGAAAAGQGEISRLDAILFLTVYIGFTAYLVSLVRGQMNQVEEQQFGAEVEELAKTTQRTPGVWLSLGLVVAGVAALAGGAEATVSGAIGIASSLGISDRVIGLTIVSAGTGLPEVVTSVVSSIRGRNDLAIGNVIGSNLFNILATLGITALISPLPVDAGIIASDMWWMLGITLLLFPFMMTGYTIDRWEGTALLGIYVVYVTILLVQ